MSSAWLGLRFSHHISFWKFASSGHILFSESTILLISVVYRFLAFLMYLDNDRAKKEQSFENGLLGIQKFQG